MTANAGRLNPRIALMFFTGYTYPASSYEPPVPDTQRSVTPPVNPTAEARTFIEKWAKLHDVNFAIAGGENYLTVTFKGKVEVLQTKLDPENREELKSTLYDMVYG
jgi:hypothetical protein